MHNLAIIALALAPLALAKTDLTGCTSSVSGPSLIWYVPGTGELCEFLDCGGGRAPPKTTVPGCAAYSGTATYSPNYLPGYGPNATPTSTTSASLATDVQPTGYGNAPAASSASDLWGWASASNSRAELFSSDCATSTETPLTYLSTVAPITTPAPVYGGSMSASSVVVSTLATQPQAGSNTTVTSAAPAPSAFQGAASGKSIAGGLGFIGFMAAALALA